MEGKTDLGATIAGPGEGGGGRLEIWIFINDSGRGHPALWI